MKLNADHDRGFVRSEVYDGWVPAGFMVSVDYYKNSADFMIFRVLGISLVKTQTAPDTFETKAVPQYQKRDSHMRPDPTIELDEAEALAQGYFKWDGCSNWEFNSRPIMLHFCTRGDIANFGAVMLEVYDTMNRHFKFS